MWRKLANIPSKEAVAGLLSLAIGIVLMALKFIAYFITGSSAIFSDALESIVNVLASGVAMYSLMVAHSPADLEHPYGHGKVEFISAGFEGGMILLASVVMAVKTLDTVLFHPVRVEELGIGLTLVGVAMVVNGAVGGYLVHFGRKQKSLTLEADGWHLLSDAITSIAAISALLLVRWLHWPMADPIFALMIALYVAWTGYKLLQRSTAGLMDKQDQADELVLRRILDAHHGPAGRQPRICSYHKLRHRHSGRYLWVEFHIMIPADLNVRQGHRVASELEYEIEQALGGNATAHIEPCLAEDCAVCGQQAAAVKAEPRTLEDPRPI